MYRICALLSIAFITSCGGNKTDDSKSVNAAGPSASGNPYQDVAGVYQDTLPCPDCPGILTELTLHPDSTFMLRERILNAERRPAKSTNLRGVFAFIDGSSKIKLTSSQADAAQRLFEVTENGLLATDVQAQPGTDLTLEMRERIMGKVGADFISYRLEDKGTYPSVIYMNMPGSDIVINKPALDRMKDAEKAIVSFYAMQFNTACDDNKCALESAMSTDKNSLEATVRKWMPSAVFPSADEMRASRIDTKLVFLNFNLQGSNLSVNYSTMSSDFSMRQSTDVFEITDSEVKLIKKGEVLEQKRNSPPSKEQARERK